MTDNQKDWNSLSDFEKKKLYGTAVLVFDEIKKRPTDAAKIKTIMLGIFAVYRVSGGKLVEKDDDHVSN